MGIQNRDFMDIGEEVNFDTQESKKKFFEKIFKKVGQNGDFCPNR